MPDPAPSVRVPTIARPTPAHEDPWAIVIAERARHQSRQRTGTEAFWRYYLTAGQALQVSA